MKRHVLHRRLLIGLAGLAGLAGCETAESIGPDQPIGGGVDETYSITLDAQLVADGTDVPFVTRVGDVVPLSVADVVGRPYFVASFPAGFASSDDEPIDFEWGTVPDELAISFTTPSTYADGPYDLVLVVYAATEVPSDARDSGLAPPQVIPGDLATYTIDQTAVLPGDPAIAPGVVRVNVAGADQAFSVENRTPVDVDDAGELAAAMTNTIMIVP